MAFKPKGMDMGKYASVLKNLLAAVEEKPADASKSKVKVKIKNIDTQGGDVVVVPPHLDPNSEVYKSAGEVPPQFQKKDEKDGKPAEKKDAKPGDKKEDGKKDEGKKLPPWLEKKKDA
jgi:hypothetical protein